MAAAMRLTDELRSRDGFAVRMMDGQPATLAGEGPRRPTFPGASLLPA